MAYADESGDDGRNGSPLFILTTIYFHHTFWKSNYEIIRMFRKRIRDQYGFLNLTNFMQRDLLMTKNHFTDFLQISKERRYYTSFLD